MATLNAKSSPQICPAILLVNPNTRGQGIGRKVLDAFKQMGKPIILEVVPPEAEDDDTVRRIKFYERNGFRKAEHIEYTRSDEDGTPYTMDIYYWPPDEVSEETILQQMATVCRDIHNFRALKHYGRLVADQIESLSWYCRQFPAVLSAFASWSERLISTTDT